MTELLLYWQEHIEGYHELSAKTKMYFATAVSMWDAEYYIKVDDDVHVNLGEKLFKFVRLFVWIYSSMYILLAND